MIKDHYSINQNTFAILPGKNIEYESIVIEGNQTIFVRQSPFELIRQACYEDWSTYEGRRQAVIKHTKFHKKTPIPVNITKNIFFFPTHSPKKMFNHWISCSHILRIFSNPQQPNTSIIKFHQAVELSLHVSPYILQKQMNRTLECIVKIKSAICLATYETGI